MKKEALKEMASQLGADVCGIADVDSFSDAPEGFHPKSVFAEAKSVIVFGKSFLKATYLSDSNAPYTLNRNMLIQFIDTLTITLSNHIESKGYYAVPVPSSEPYEYWNTERRHGRGIISLKHSAQLAGIGCIGKNTLLVNEKYGNRLWLGGVITNIEFEPDPPAKNLCPENCHICLDICPQSALDGITIEQKKCREICFGVTEGGGWLIKCNLCRTKCPYAKI